MKPASEWATRVRTAMCIHGARKMQFCQACITELIVECQRDAIEAAAVVADRYHEPDVARHIRALAAPPEGIGADLPAHLRDDAPLATCSKCGRKSVLEGPSLRCGMRQPDGTSCDGVWRR